MNETTKCILKYAPWAASIDNVLEPVRRACDFNDFTFEFVIEGDSNFNRYHAEFNVHHLPAIIFIRNNSFTIYSEMQGIRQWITLYDEGL